MSVTTSVSESVNVSVPLPTSVSVSVTVIADVGVRTGVSIDNSPAIGVIQAMLCPCLWHFSGIFCKNLLSRMGMVGACLRVWVGV